MPPRLLPLAALLVLLLAPSAAAAARSVPHGFHGVTWDRALPGAEPALQDGSFALLSGSGVETARVTFSWAAMQPSAGAAPDFSRADRIVAAAGAHRVAVLPVVLRAPDWAARPHGPGATEGSLAPPNGTAAYAAFLQALVGRYGPRGTFWAERPDLPRRPIRDWQIWNEPNLIEFWDTPDWQRDYGRLVRASNRALKAADRGSHTILAGLANRSWTALEELHRFGRVRGHFDAAAIHPYTRHPRGVVRITELARRALRRRGSRRASLWVTETGWVATVGRRAVPDWARPFATTDSGMAAKLRDTYTLLGRNRRRLGVTRVFWYSAATAYGGDPKGDIFDFSGLLRFDGAAFARTPSLRAYRTVARRQQGCARTPSGICR